MALLKPAQFFSCSGVSFNSFLIRSMLASLLATICSAVSCGSPGWGRTACLVTLPALPAFAGFAGPRLFRRGRALRCGRCLLPFPDPEHPGEYADHATDRASQHAADRSGGLVAGLRSLLDALHQALRLSCGGRVEKQG